MFHFAFAEIMQKRTPLRVVLQVVGDTPGEKNVSGIAAIHHPLRDVDAGAGNVGLFVQVGDFIDRAAVNSHSHVKFGMIFQCLADFQRAQHRRFRTGAKNERAAVAGRQAQQLAFRFGDTELLRSAHDLLLAFESAHSAR